jgi:hypothetical protein
VTHAGARTLAQHLARHPEVVLASRKRIDRYTPMRFGRGVESGLDVYDTVFSSWRGQRCRVEVSPVYFDGGPELIRRVAEDLPDTRVLLVLREPAVRLWEGYRDKHDRGRLPRGMTFDRYVERSSVLRLTGSDRFEGNRYFRSLSCGVYADHLAPWLDAFTDRIMVTFAEDVERDGAAVVSRVHAWLDLEPAAGGAAPAGRPRGSMVGPSGWRSRWLETFESGGTTEPARFRRRRPASPADPRTAERAMRRVEDFYAPANRRLAALLASRGITDVPDWLVHA